MTETVLDVFEEILNGQIITPEADDYTKHVYVVTADSGNGGASTSC